MNNGGIKQHTRSRILCKSPKGTDTIQSVMLKIHVLAYYGTLSLTLRIRERANNGQAHGRGIRRRNRAATAHASVCAQLCVGAWRSRPQPAGSLLENTTAHRAGKPTSTKNSNAPRRPCRRHVTGFHHGWLFLAGKQMLNLVIQLKGNQFLRYYVTIFKLYTDKLHTVSMFWYAYSMEWVAQWSQLTATLPHLSFCGENT